MGSWVSFPSGDGDVAAYLAAPPRDVGAAPGVIVLQELWGLDRFVVEVADRFAAAGYVALAPDLYAVGGARPAAITPERVESAEEWLNAAASTYPALLPLLVSAKRRAAADVPADIDETVSTVVANANLPRHPAVVHSAFAFLRDHERCAGRPIAAVGFCMGGALAAGLACDEPSLGATVVFYGNSPDAERVASMRAPVLGLYGGDDTRIAEGLPDFEAALTKAGVDHELLVYPGVLHAFANDTRPWYHAEAARDAWARTLTFLAATLDPFGSTPVG